MKKVILCIDDSQRSNEVIKMFQEAGISYDISPISADEVPFVRYGDDLYIGPGEIWLLLDALREIKEEEKKGTLFEYIPTWRCKDCGESGSMKSGAPNKCSKCGSKNLDIPPIKKDGPLHSGEKLKRH